LAISKNYLLTDNNANVNTLKAKGPVSSRAETDRWLHCCWRCSWRVWWRWWQL